EEDEGGAGGGDVPVDRDDGLSRVVIARHSCEPADRTRGLTTKAEERARARRDVVTDGDRRRPALRVEEPTWSDVDVAADIDHSTVLGLAYTRDRDAGVVP